MTLHVFLSINGRPLFDIVLATWLDNTCPVMVNEITSLQCYTGIHSAVKICRGNDSVFCLLMKGDLRWNENY